MQTIARSIRFFDAVAQMIRRWCLRVGIPTTTSPLSTTAHSSAADRDTTNESVQYSSIADDETEVASEFQLGGDDGEVVLQQIMRIRDATGRESVYATLRAEFEAGQRYVPLHVAFLPPFAELPTIAAEVIEGPSAVVKVVQAMHHGAHLEVRLEDAIEIAAYCTVEMAAYPAPVATDPLANESA